MQTKQINKQNLPLQRIKAGNITATIWENAINGNKAMSVTLTRTYKDKNNEWKTANSLGLTDIPKAVLALNKAYEFMVMKGNEKISTVHEVNKSYMEMKEEVIPC